MHTVERVSRRSSQAASPLRPARSGWHAESAPFAKVGNQAMQRRLIQAKLTVNQPGDRFEQEADRVADEIMRIPERAAAPAEAPSGHDRPTPPASTRPTTIQRLCSHCAAEKEEKVQRKAAPGTSKPPRPRTISHHSSAPRIQRLCPECEEELHRQATTEAQETPDLTPAVASRISALPGSGQPLQESARSFFESGFGVDFSQVRVHTDSSAAETARAVSAHAFTVGPHIVFAAGQYAPQTSSGKRLLAHELTHVVQQGAHGTMAVQRHSCREGEGPPAPEPPIPGEEGPHPLVFRGVSQRRSRRPSVGDAQELLNLFLARLREGSFTCSPGADLAAINQLRATLEQDPLEVDCRFGPNTEIATKMFQRCVFPGQREEWDGKIGKHTWPELEKLRPRPPAPRPSPPPSSPPAPAPLCTAVPTATPATCPDRHAAYCAARACFPFNPWLTCACTVSGEVCDAIDAFTFTGATGTALGFCVAATGSVFVPRALTIAKGHWLRSTNQCIWGHWRAALDALHDPTLPIPSSVTPEWSAAITTCRTSGVSSTACCRAHVVAEQNAIDRCGPYNSAAFGRLPTDVPGAPLCGAIAALFVSPPFTGDFGNVADRIAYGNTRCCP